jgi:hypothetical protein
MRSTASADMPPASPANSAPASRLHRTLISTLMLRWLSPALSLISTGAALQPASAAIAAAAIGEDRDT